MSMRELFWQCYTSIRAHKIRSLLAMISILWGTLAVVMLLALGEGFYLKQTASFTRSVYDNSIPLYPGYTSKPWQGYGSNRQIQFNEYQLNVLKTLPGVADIQPIYSADNPNISRSDGSPLRADIQGVSYRYPNLKPFVFDDQGRFFSSNDERHAAQVAVITGTPDKHPFKVGEPILIQGIPFTLIGVDRPEEDSNFSFGSNITIFIPKSTFIALWQQETPYFQIKPDGSLSFELFIQTVRTTLARLNHFDPKDHSAVRYYNAQSFGNTLRAMLRAIELFLIFSGVMTLSIGALGVANIMFLTVTERTREIGLRMAIGAKPRQILWQFQLESSLMILGGALPGILISYLSILALNRIGLPDWMGVLTINPWGLGITLICITLLGFIAGYYPARRAARLDPVIALTQ